jgi:hypothetical protein
VLAFVAARVYGRAVQISFQGRSTIKATVVAVFCVALLTAGAAPSIDAAEPREIEAEEQGLDLASQGRQPGTRDERPASIGQGVDLLLIPDSTNDRVMAFDPTTDNLVDENLTPMSAALSTPKCAMLKAGGTGFLVSDQLEAQTDGTIVGIYLPSPVDGPRGVYELPSGHLLVADGGGVHEITRANTHVEAKITGVSCHTITLAEGVVPVVLQRFSAGWAAVGRSEPCRSARSSG